MVTSPGVVSDIVGGKKWIPLSDVEGMSPALRGDGGRVRGGGQSQAWGQDFHIGLTSISCVGVKAWRILL